MAVKMSKNGTYEHVQIRDKNKWLSVGPPAVFLDTPSRQIRYLYEAKKAVVLLVKLMPAQSTIHQTVVNIVVTEVIFFYSSIKNK